MSLRRLLWPAVASSKAVDLFPIPSNINIWDACPVGSEEFISCYLQFNLFDDGDYYTGAVYNGVYTDGLWHAQSGPSFDGSQYVYRWVNSSESILPPNNGPVKDPPQPEGEWVACTGTFTWYYTDATPSGGAYDATWSFNIEIAVNNGSEGPAGDPVKTISVTMNLGVVL